MTTKTVNRKYNRMNPRIKKLWVAALRSGDYLQGKHVLRLNASTETRFCCLGVLCNLHAIDHPEIAAYQLDPNKYMNHEYLVPDSVAKWAGLPGGAATKLTNMNDTGSCPCSFNQIADWIEKNI